MTPEETWKLCLNFCEKELSKQQYTTWIKPLSGDVDEKLKQLTISAPNQFVLQWVKERLNDKLHSLLEESSNISSITYNVNKKTKRSLSVEAIITESPDPNKIKPVKTNGLNKSFNFDNFVTGKANQLACAAAKQIAEKPGTTYNPLFVYGGVGLGKTHLMHAIGNHLKSIQPNAKIKYLHAERYVHDVVKAYENKDFDSFKKNYHSLDLLLIDDIQFIAKKNRTQEEFFYAFNTLIENKKQIIITCDSYPKEIVGVDERLRTRFSWGLTVSIDPPELEMRVAILLKKAAENKIQLSEEVAFFVAKQIRSNVRELEGALNRIVAMSNFTGREIDLSLAKESLKDLIAVRGRQISVENIQKTVADFYKIKIADIHSKKRSRNYSRPRQIAMSLTRELTNLSFPEIGEAFGGRHHTTIMHACDEIESLRLSDQAIGQDLGFFTQVLKG
ncbi:MAG: chromosomal replication initiator DnaA [Methylophilales bacterium BACL14 MAG-120920-bin58]|nr:MAG: chromosomal replication initiator DnaA [Methylophilales bacterium BACL14 MAG-120920-bin58]